VILPAAPEHTFASDNAAAAHPTVIDAIARANEGHALAYGADPITRRVESMFDVLFDAEVATYLVWGGTGANVMALTSLLGPGDSVVCTDVAHINVDEAGAPERITGSKLLDVPNTDGRLVASQIDELAHLLGNEHHAQPSVVSITQPTELGTLYSPSQVAAICETAHRHGMRVHLDGARIANATAALGGDRRALRSFTVDAGVDVVSFGGTKGGLIGGEAVVFLDPALARRARHVRKLVTQLPSKMRYVAAQFEAILSDDLWIDLAAHANSMASLLYERTAAIDGIHIERAPEVNSVFPTLPRHVADPLREWSFFWDWDMPRGLYRWMTAWDTTEDDVSSFVAGVEAAIA
jgi:threonine aldolase